MVALDEILTEGVTTLFTVIVIWLLVAEEGEGHTAFDVMTTVTLSLLTNEAVVKVALLVPTFAPFSFH